VCAAFADAAPVIDGDLNDACWQKAEKVSDFVHVGSADAPARKRTAMQLLYSETHLYLAVDCWVGAGAKVEGPPPQGDAADQYTSTYSVEIFLDPQATRSNYYQLCWSVGGKRFDGLRGGPTAARSYNGTWRAAAKVLADRWTSEAAVPLAELKHATPLPGAEWGFNICRNDVGNYSVWKYTGGAFHTPEIFGTLIIGDYDAWWRSVFVEKAGAALQRLAPANAKRIARNEHLRGLHCRARAMYEALQTDDGRIRTRADFLTRYRRMRELTNTLGRSGSTACGATRPSSVPAPTRGTATCHEKSRHCALGAVGRGRRWFGCSLGRRAGRQPPRLPRTRSVL